MYDRFQKFICDMYNVRLIIDVDATRLQIFIETYSISVVNEPFNLKKVQSFDASRLPPCKSELLQQFLRANYTIVLKDKLKKVCLLIDIIRL